MTIETERLRLIPVSEEHTAFIFSHFTHEVTRYMMPEASKSMEDTRQVVRRFIMGWQNHTDYVWMIIWKESGECLGLTGLHHAADPVPELGIWIKTAAHGHHYGREAIGGVMAHARSRGNHKLRYPVDRRNTASKKIPLFYGGRLVSGIREMKTADGRILEEEVYEVPLH